MDEPSDSTSDIDERQALSPFVRMGVFVEGGLGVFGWIVGAWRGIDWAALLSGSPEAVLWGVFGGLGLVGLAVASGVGEEMLFRGWLQAEVGLVGASVLFGAAHVWGREGWPYGLYAAVMGAGLGGLLIVTGSLWAPILAHGLNNLLGFLALRDGWFAPPEDSTNELRPPAG